MSSGLVLLMVGDELLDGRSRDTNSDWIIDRATAERWRVQAVEVLPDDTAVIAEAIGRHAGDAAAILLSGGLGPTTDDVTRDGLARALGVELFFDDEIAAHIEALFRSRGRRMPESNRRQAYRTPASRVIPNPVGSAVGLLEELDGTLIALLPGVPAELKAMFVATVQTEFSTRLTGGAPYSRRIRTAQIAESVLVDLVRDSVPDIDTYDTAWCVSTWGVDLLLRDQDAARLDSAAARIAAAIGDFTYGEGQTSLPAAVVQVRGELGQSVAVAESCTGGLVGAAITSVPGSSLVFLGGVTAYSDDVKTTMLGVPASLIARHGAVSEEVAATMAAGVRDRFGVDWGVSTTGVAGPDGGTVEKPVGTVCVGLAGRGDVLDSTTIRLGGDRDLVRRWTVAAALDGLRRGRIRRR